jgi:DNA polymerase-3 subunit alpha
MSTVTKLSINKNLFMLFKIDTTGFPIYDNGEYPNHEDLAKYENSRIVRLCWGVYDYKEERRVLRSFIVQPDGYTIENDNIHKISQAKAIKQGKDIGVVFDTLRTDLLNVKFIVGHNMEFILNILFSELFRANKVDIMKELEKLETVCTGELTKDAIKLKAVNGRYKMPKFTEMYKFYFNVDYDSDGNNGKKYLRGLARCLFKAIKDGNK